MCGLRPAHDGAAFLLSCRSEAKRRNAHDVERLTDCSCIAATQFPKMRERDTEKREIAENERESVGFHEALRFETRRSTIITGSGAYQSRTQA